MTRSHQWNLLQELSLQMKLWTKVSSFRLWMTRSQVWRSKCCLKLSRWLNESEEDESLVRDELLSLNIQWRKLWKLLVNLNKKSWWFEIISNRLYMNQFEKVLKKFYQQSLQPQNSSENKRRNDQKIKVLIFWLKFSKSRRTYGMN